MRGKLSEDLGKEISGLTEEFYQGSVGRIPTTER